MQLIDVAFLDHLYEEAKTTPRLRMNYNFHDSYESPSQRLLNALELGAAIPVHRHRHTAETYILLRGRIRVMFYNDLKEEIESEILDTADGKYGLNIPAGQWHSLEVLESGSVIFEAKDGPFALLSDEDILK